jgi:hypothetical protein
MSLGLPFTTDIYGSLPCIACGRLTTAPFSVAHKGLCSQCSKSGVAQA